MSYYFRTWHTTITAELAEREPMSQRLFADEPPAAPERQLPTINRAKYRPWKKPEIIRAPAQPAERKQPSGHNAIRDKAQSGPTRS